MNIIESKNLDLFYSSHQALKNINLSFPENSVSALIGPSGCGKSTFLKTLNRMNDLIDGVKVIKDNYICIYNDKLLSCNKSRIEAMKDAIRLIPDIADMQVFTIFTGKDSSIDEINELNKLLLEYNQFVEIYPIPGGQELYSYIIGIE